MGPMRIQTYRNQFGGSCTADFDPDDDLVAFLKEAATHDEFDEIMGLDDNEDDRDAAIAPVYYAEAIDAAWDVEGPLYVDE